MFNTIPSIEWTSPVAQRVKNLPAMQETRVWSLCWEDSLEKKMATYSIIVVWRIPRTEEPGGLQSMASQRVRHDWMTSLSLLIILEWSAISFSRRAFQPRDRSWVSCIGWWIIYHWATRETIAYQRYILNIRTKRLRENEKYIHEKTNQKKN